ncbi:murein DD-endopeptidase MepM [Vibrio sp. SCSIO 43136]|uniref:murein DD-endopeptidase MepM n=1 Tax=Vibrio sp. SCSIO 43136 TaxID=2819101 RepID=UPI0020750607|nr:murein DD-endopeptidase MepM [Vibrio sp. SCSIO 43136]USD64537.1 murein DD-endopeptidase MepM [Vibrio sp. SCSIO 43136]
MTNFQNAATLTWQRLSKNHRTAIMGAFALTSAFMLWTPNVVEVTHEVSRKPIEITTEQQSSLADQDSEPFSEPLGEQIDSNAPEFSAPKDELDYELEAEPVKHSHVVAKNELVSAIFSQYGLSSRDMYAMIGVDRSLERVNPGMNLEWQVDDEGKILELRIERSAKTADVYTWQDDKYHFEKIETQGEIQPIFLSGRVTDNFYNAAKSAGLTDGQIITLSNAMQWKFNFGRSARKGDSFAVKVNKEFIDGKPVGRGEVSALLYKSGGKEYTAIKASDGHFYDVKGESLSRAFNRLPTNKRYRISSPFNPNRRHPVTGRVAPHNGTDFATPIGTPIMATGDGVVVKAQKHPLAGNYVVIKHGREYMTRYLHLHRILVKPGQRVTRGQKIALSGNTGRSTGPHLHYELIKHGRPVNAMKVPLPQAAPIAKSERSAFISQAKSVLTALRDQA